MPEDTWDWQKVGNSGKSEDTRKLTKARATRKATGYSQLATGIEARKAKTAAQYARAVADWEADKTTKTPGPPPFVAWEARERHDRGWRRE
jgi:hypothetical protein